MSRSRKIPYNKPKGTKQLWHGGPRDMQQRTLYNPKMLELEASNITIDALEDVLLNNEMVIDKLKNKLENESMLPITEVKQRIDNAIYNTKIEMQKKHDEEILNLNDIIGKLKNDISILFDQLNESKSIVNNLKSELILKDAIIKKLKDSLEEGHYIDIKKELRTLIKELKNKYNGDIDRPSISSNIFIDPLEDKSELDAHINIKSSTDNQKNRNIKKDVDKLRTILNKGKDDN